MESNYLVGWKRIAEYVGVHWQTIRYWHHTRLKLPFVKSFPSKQGRPIVSKIILEAWVDEIGKGRR